MSKVVKGGCFSLVVAIILFVGEVKCFYKAFTGLGCVVGWIDIEDTK